MSEVATAEAVDALLADLPALQEGGGAAVWQLRTHAAEKRAERRWMSRAAALAADPSVSGDDLRRIETAVRHRSYYLAAPLSILPDPAYGPCYRPGSRPVVAALAGNPNTPADVLADAAQAQPEAFCRNPAATLVALEDPNWPARLARNGLRGLLRCPEAPVGMILS